MASRRRKKCILKNHFENGQNWEASKHIGGGLRNFAKE